MTSYAHTKHRGEGLSKKKKHRGEEKRITNDNNNKWIEPNKNNSDILSKRRTYMGK